MLSVKFDNWLDDAAWLGGKLDNGNRSLQNWTAFTAPKGIHIEKENRQHFYKNNTKL